MLDLMRFVIATAVFAAAAATAAAAAPAPSLRIASMSPTFRVAGAHFRAAERVRVTFVDGNDTLARRTTASALGTFTVSFGTVTVDRCTGFVVRAVGSGGSTATVKRLPLPECMPQGAPG